MARREDGAERGEKPASRIHADAEWTALLNSIQADDRAVASVSGAARMKPSAVSDRWNSPVRGEVMNPRPVSRLRKRLAPRRCSRKSEKESES